MSKITFLQRVRYVLREVMKFHPVKKELRWGDRRKRPNENGRNVWHNQCNICSNWYISKEVEVDHRKNNPPLKSLEDIPPYAKNLLVIDVDDMQLLCKKCHGIKTYAERYGKTWHQAAKRKKEIAEIKREKLKL